MTNRVNEFVSDIVREVRLVLEKHKVTPEEYRAGIKYLIEAGEAKELALLVDAFFNITIVGIRNAGSKSSPSELQGPYFLESAPVVTDTIQTDPSFGGTPMILEGQIIDTDKNPVEGAELFIWQSTPDGKYSGFHAGVPAGFYRGKVITGRDGKYRVRSTVPVPYQMKNDGPVGALFEMMGRHSWRPAHVHYKIRKPGYQELTTQVYFENGKWVGDDSCSGSRIPELIIPEQHEGDALLMPVNFRIEKAA